MNMIVNLLGALENRDLENRLARAKPAVQELRIH